MLIDSILTISGSQLTLPEEVKSVLKLFLQGKNSPQGQIQWDETDDHKVLIDSHYGKIRVRLANKQRCESCKLAHGADYVPITMEDDKVLIHDSYEENPHLVVIKNAVRLMVYELGGTEFDMYATDDNNYAYLGIDITDLDTSKLE